MSRSMVRCPFRPGMEGCTARASSTQLQLRTTWLPVVSSYLSREVRPRSSHKFNPGCNPVWHRTKRRMEHRHNSVWNRALDRVRSLNGSLPWLLFHPMLPIQDFQPVEHIRTSLILNTPLQCRIPINRLGAPSRRRRVRRHRLFQLLTPSRLCLTLEVRCRRLQMTFRPGQNQNASQLQ